jgi:hypothetical protein
MPMMTPDDRRTRMKIGTQGIIICLNLRKDIQYEKIENKKEKQF